jgi:hypothetical protein
MSLGIQADGELSVKSRDANVTEKAPFPHPPPSARPVRIRRGTKVAIFKLPT